MKLLNRPSQRPAQSGRAQRREAALAAASAPEAEEEPTIPIGSVEWRQRVRLSGRVRSIRIQPWSGVATLECILVDPTGGIGVVFLGRRTVPGIHPGTEMTVEGTASSHHGRLTILNPEYELRVAETE